MSEVFNPEQQRALELAGALQATIKDLENRDFNLDIQQEAALESIGVAWLNGKDSGYVEMATSTGKTTIEAILAEAAVNAGKRVLLLAPTISIARQISGKEDSKETGITRFSNLHERGLVRHHFGGQKANNTTPVVVSTYQGFLRDYKRDHNRLGHFDVVIADECHRSLGKETSKAMTTAFPGAFKIGLSATPDYALDRKSDEVYEESLFEFSLHSAIESGKTAPVRTLLYETEQNIKLSDVQRDFTEKELAPLTHNIERNGIAAKLVKELVENGRQGIVACVPGAANFHARFMADLLGRKEFGTIRAAAVGSHMTNQEVALQLNLFDRGELDVLTFTRSIEEGWDSDKASFCLNLSPTTSPVRTKQLLGRILRKKEGDLEGIYVDFIDKQSGVNKQPYTALHALGIEEVYIHRVLGRQVNNGDGRLSSMRDLPVFSEKLYRGLLKAQGKTVSDILTHQAEQTIDPLVAHWEKVLADEGMPAELGFNPFFSGETEIIYDETKQKLIRTLGDIPTRSEVIEALPSRISKSTRKLLQQVGVILSLESIDIEDFTENEDTTEQTVMSNALVSDAKEVLYSLTDGRDIDVIAQVVGLDDEPKTLREIGKIYGVSGSHAGNIYNKARAMLKHPVRANRLRAYMYYEKDEKKSSYNNLVPKEQEAHREMVRDRLLSTGFMYSKNHLFLLNNLTLGMVSPHINLYRGKKTNILDVRAVSEFKTLLDIRGTNLSELSDNARKIRSQVEKVYAKSVVTRDKYQKFPAWKYKNALRQINIALGRQQAVYQALNVFIELCDARKGKGYDLNSRILIDSILIGDKYIESLRLDNELSDPDDEDDYNFTY